MIRIRSAALPQVMTMTAPTAHAQRTPQYVQPTEDRGALTVDAFRLALPPNFDGSDFKVTILEARSKEVDHIRLALLTKSAGFGGGLQKYTFTDAEALITHCLRRPRPKLRIM